LLSSKTEVRIIAGLGIMCQPVLVKWELSTSCKLITSKTGTHRYTHTSIHIRIHTLKCQQAIDERKRSHIIHQDIFHFCQRNNNGLLITCVAHKCVYSVCCVIVLGEHRSKLTVAFDQHQI